KDFAEAHIDLGRMLERQGKFGEALKAFRRGHELGSKKKGWTVSSARFVWECENLVAVDGKLPRIIKGELEPADTAERPWLAYLCKHPARRLYAASVRFFEEAFAADPKLAENFQRRHRYDAAGAAAMAGCGQGKDDPTLDDDQRVRLRQQARDWLAADLAGW